MTFLGLCDPTPAESRTALGAVAAIGRRFGHVPVYARVDLLQGADGAPLVLEVELVDPNLSLILYPPAAADLAAAIRAATAS